jgi:hypothetical protein
MAAPMLKIAWTASIVVRPAAMHRAMTEGARIDILNPARVIKPKAAITATIPRSPSSSPMSAKIMSVPSSGTETPLLPAPAPDPKIPPAFMATRDWTTW